MTNPDHYRVIFENERVRVLEYTDQPGDMTTPHEHPDRVMYTLSSFQRRPEPVASDPRRRRHPGEVPPSRVTGGHQTSASRQSQVSSPDRSSGTPVGRT